MVSVSALVVQPAKRIAFDLLFLHVRGLITLEVLDGYPEFTGGIFGKIMGEALMVQAAGKAVLHDLEAVAVNGMQVVDETPCK